MKYIVEIEIDTGEFFHATGKSMFTLDDPPLIFDTREQAQLEANRWNTGRVIEYEKDSYNR
tara:strand:+ start:393 stop:575 length:183 start_codon:yes stop_codon:yes gene_type:complete